MIGGEPSSFVGVVCSFGEDLSFEVSEGILRVVEVILFIAGVAFSTTDGSFLIVPSGLWPKTVAVEAASKDASSPSFSTFLFARHKYDQPVAVLSGHHKASVVVKPSPMLYHFPQTTKESSDKENQDHFKTRFNTNLPYRSIFAVLTIDTVYIYDTAQNISVLKNTKNQCY